MKLTAVFLTAASLVLKGSAMALTIDHLYPSTRSLHGMKLYRRTVSDNATYDAIINATQSAVGQQAIQNDINNLTATTLSVLNSFNAIGAQLLVIDNQKITTTTFAGPWAALQQQFIAHLTDSRNAASNVSAFCQELSTTIAPFVLNAIPGQSPISSADAVTILQEVIAEAQSLQATATVVSNDFGGLITSMVEFTANFSAFAATQQVDLKKIEDLRDDLLNLEAEIALLHTQIDAIGVTIGITVYASASLAAAFPEFLPFILGAGALATSGEIAALGVLSAQLKSAQDSVIDDKAQITLLTQELAEIGQANSTLFTISNSTIPAMSLQLGAFQGIWNAVESDLNQLIVFVTTARNAPLLAYEILKTEVSPLYTALSGAMLAYATGIQNAGTTSNVVKLPVSLAHHAPLTQTAIKIQAILKTSALATS